MSDQAVRKRESDLETPETYENPSVVELGDLAELTGYTVSIRV